jgi:hypothetical protein
MLPHIVEELNQNRENASNLLIEIYDALSQMTCYSKYCYNLYDSDLFEVFEFSSLINQKWGQLIITEPTFNKLRQFSDEWLIYRRNAPYGDDEIFVYSDIEWHRIIKNYLLPALESMERDFEKHGIEYTSYKITYDPDARPSDEDILERGRTLYGLLLKHKVIKRYYLDE